MSSWYPVLLHTHMAAVALSGTLFAARGVAINLLGARWPMIAPVRYLTYAVDSVLLAAALALTAVIGQYPFADNWLTAKVVLLVVYIVLGTFALKRGKTKTVRLACFGAALAVFAFILSIAHAHNPLGFLAG